MNENFICLEMICPMCGDTHYVTVLNDDFKNWRAGELIQKAMPYLEPYERESNSSPTSAPNVRNSCSGTSRSEPIGSDFFVQFYY